MNALFGGKTRRNWNLSCSTAWLWREGRARGTLLLLQPTTGAPTMSCTWLPLLTLHAPLLFVLIHLLGCRKSDPMTQGQILRKEGPRSFHGNILASRITKAHCDCWEAWTLLRENWPQVSQESYCLQNTLAMCKTRHYLPHFSSYG